jgi:hypothetical protein
MKFCRWLVFDYRVPAQRRASLQLAVDRAIAEEQSFEVYAQGATKQAGMKYVATPDGRVLAYASTLHSEDLAAKAFVDDTEVP